MGSDSKIDLRRHSIAQLDTYDVTADELDRIQTECMDVGQDFQFASISGTVGISFLIALVLTKIESNRIFNAFFTVMLFGLVGCFYFGVRYVRKRRAFVPIIQRIKDRQVGPVGEAGSELSPSALASLPVTQAEPAPNVKGTVTNSTGATAVSEEAAAAPLPTDAQTGERP
jgi:hypothetical protein